MRAVIERCAAYEKYGNFVYDDEKEQRQRDALELKKWRDATRKRFEERMVRKAVRAGLDKEHYLKIGAEVPTAARLAELKSMDKAAAWGEWKARHGQHCYAMHMDPCGCQRERACAFLHVDVKTAAADEPTWLQERNEEEVVARKSRDGWDLPKKQAWFE